MLEGNDIGQNDQVRGVLACESTEQGFGMFRFWRLGFSRISVLLKDVNTLCRSMHLLLKWTFALTASVLFDCRLRRCLPLCCSKCFVTVDKLLRERKRVWQMITFHSTVQSLDTSFEHYYCSAVLHLR